MYRLSVYHANRSAHPTAIVTESWSSWTDAIQGYKARCEALTGPSQELGKDDPLPTCDWENAIVLDIQWAEGAVNTPAGFRLNAIPEGVGSIIHSPWLTATTQPNWQVVIPTTRNPLEHELPHLFSALKRMFERGSCAAPYRISDTGVVWTPFRENDHWPWRHHAAIEVCDGAPLDLDAVLAEPENVTAEEGDLTGETWVVTEDGRMRLREIHDRYDPGTELKCKCPIYKGAYNTSTCARVWVSKSHITIGCFGGKHDHTHHDRARPTKTGGMLATWRWRTPEMVGPAAVKAKLLVSDKGAVLPRLSNLVTILSEDERFAGKIVYDEMEDEILIMGKSQEDYMITEVRLEVGARYGYEPSKDAAFAAVEAVARRNTVNALADYLKALKWDGQSRIESFLVDHMGAEDTPLNRAYSRTFFLSAVARALKPGCQVDTMLTLLGRGGLRKTRTIEALASTEFFLSDNIDIESKEGASILRGKWIAEFGEMDKLKKSTAEAVKAYLSRSIDTYRPSYARCEVDRPRRVVFVATSNESLPLVDPTGNRRFMVVNCGVGWDEDRKVDLDVVRQIRGALWGEAVHWVLAGEPWHLSPAEEKLQRDAEGSFSVENILAQECLAWAHRQKVGFSTAQCITNALGVPMESTRKHVREVSNALVRAGYTLSDNPVRTAAGRQRLWTRPEMAQVQNDDLDFEPANKVIPFPQPEPAVQEVVIEIVEEALASLPVDTDSGIRAALTLGLARLQAGDLVAVNTLPLMVSTHAAKRLGLKIEEAIPLWEAVERAKAS